MSQPDALKVSDGVDLMKQLGELRLQHVHLCGGESRTASVRASRVLKEKALPALRLRTSDLQVILEVVHEEGHVVAEPPLDGVGLVGFEVLALHLQGPAVLQLRLHPTHTQQVAEHHVVPEERWAAY